MIKRIRQCLEERSEKRLRVLYGPAIDDTFLTSDLVELNIESALQLSLHADGYERILFIAPHKPVYTVDGLSAELSNLHRETNMADRSQGQDRSMRFLSGGPFERMVLRMRDDSIRQDSSEMMGDVHTIRTLDYFMKTTDEHRTAVVFMQAEATLKYIHDPRTLAGVIGEWLRLPSSNQNICLFVFSAVEYEELYRAAEALPVPELRSLIYRRKNHQDSSGSLSMVDHPDFDELCSMLRYLKYKQGIELDESCIDTLAEWMSIEGGRLDRWMGQLGRLPVIDLNSARQSGWFSGVRTEQTSALEQLNRLVGLEEIKRRVRELKAWIVYRNRFSRGMEFSGEDSPLNHLVFTGNPGTGKTTIARLVGEIYREAGVLRRGHVVEVKGADLVAEHVGGTAVKTNQVIDSALDGILFIDEAYVLAEKDRGGFGLEALDTLLSRMEDERSRLVVIIAGYPEKIQRLMESNPGLPRRFPRENVFLFPDYSPPELRDILKAFLFRRLIPLDTAVENDLYRIIFELHAGRKETFGNAGEMRNLADVLERNRAVRLVERSLPDDTCLDRQDIPASYRQYLETFENGIAEVTNLADMVGWENLKNYVQRLQYRLSFFSEATDNNLPIRGISHTAEHLVFLGNPGSGKTAAARMMAAIYQQLHVLPRDEVFEVDWRDMINPPSGRGGLYIRQVFAEANGGVLLVNHAGPFFQSLDDPGCCESVNQLVQQMDEYHGKLCVILAGKKQDICALFDRTPQLRDNFGEEIVFDDFSTKELLALFCHLAEQHQIIFEDRILQGVAQYLDTMKVNHTKDFNNVGAVQRLFEKMTKRMAERYGSANIPVDGKSKIRFEYEDIPLPEEQSQNSFMLALPAAVEFPFHT